MKIPTMLLREVLINYGTITSIAIERDFRAIESRVENEGMSFLTITLPQLDDALLTGLSQGRLTPLMFNGFKPFKRGGSLPALLSGFFRRVFDADGFLKSDPCIDSIDAIRQVSRLYKKVELPCTDTRVKQAFERFKDNEKRVNEYRYGSFSNDPLWNVVCSYLWSDLELRASEIYCSPGVFGSGATAERYRFHERFHVRQWPTRGERLFPSSYHTSHREDDRETFESIQFLKGREERPVRVVTVPKTLKTPRIIAVEPSYAMLRQQSIWRYLKQYLEGPNFPFESIRFSDQSENRRLACSGSIDGRLSTIDLSDASDLVGFPLVSSVFKHAPTFLRMISGARTNRAELPSGEILTLRKFASMGSALCFPIESMVFFTIALTSLLRQSGKRPSRGNLIALSKEISVYGDDIIVPAHMAVGVMEDLEAKGLKVNHNKSFSTGFFRESCGGDYYKGLEVTPIYVRRLEDDSSKRLDSSDIAAYISLSNQFYMKGLWHVSQYIRDYLRNRKVRVSRSTEPVGGLTFTSAVFTDSVGWCKRTSQYLVRSVQLKPSRRKDSIETLPSALYYSFGQSTENSGATFEAREVRYSLHVSTPCRVGSRQWPGKGRRSDCSLEQSDSLPISDELNDTLEIRTGGARYATQFHCFGRLFPGDVEILEALLPLAIPKAGRGFDGTSVRPYSSNTKSRRVPTRVGLNW